MKSVAKFVLLIVVFCVLVCKTESRKRITKVQLKQKETDPLNFMRLTLMRLIYGLATRVGLEEPLSEAFNGAFVPPGVDDYYDYGGIFGRDDDYDDYDY